MASKEQSASEDDKTVPVNLLTAAVPIQYIVNDFESWTYKHSEPAKLLESISNREVVRYLVSVDIIDIMSTGRLEAAEKLKSRIQAQADNLGLGVEVLFVGLQDIHPPIGDKTAPVAGSFEEVIGAQQEMRANILKHKEMQQRWCPEVEEKRQKLLSEAKGASFERILTSEAKAEQFRNLIKAYQAGPDVFKQRKYYGALANSLTNIRKYIIVPEKGKRDFSTQSKKITLLMTCWAQDLRSDNQSKL